MYDAVEQFVKDAELCVAVLGKGENFTFIDLSKRIGEDTTDDALS